MTTVSAQVLIKNEARFVWYSIMSVIDFVDKVYVLDTGSEDDSWKIIETIKKGKYGSKLYIAKDFGTFDEEKTRQRLLDEINTDWFIVVDGDEIWWKDSIKTVTEFVRNEGLNFESVVIPTINVVGDMYHYQEEKAGNYQLLGKVGHYNLRAINKNIPGLKSFGEHGIWGWVDCDNKMIQDRDPSKIKYLSTPYLHATFLQRAGNLSLDSLVYKRKQKLKHEIGLSFPKDYYYPESFFINKPDFIPNIWTPMDHKFLLRSAFETPLRKIKRRVLPRKIGY